MPKNGKGADGAVDDGEDDVHVERPKARTTSPQDVEMKKKEKTDLGASHNF